MSLIKPYCYVWDEKLLEECDRLPAVSGRASMVHNLIEAYGLFRRFQVVRSSPATNEDMREFHSELYLDHLKKFVQVDDDYMSNAQDEEFGIGYDCPPVSNMLELVSSIAGGSITAARCLLLGITDVAINWCGGWHHAHRLGASGFCYINDIVIAIEKLRKKFPKVLYIDLDVHHGNGVQDAYSLSKSVFTLSFHKYEPGFYPGTGGIDDIGTGHSCNFPLHAGYSDNTMEYAFEKVFNLVLDYFKPDAIVAQCGADALAQDPNGGGNLTAHGYCQCVRRILNKRKPTMLLGGGGYNHPNTARLWASLTSMIAGVHLDEDIPDHSQWPLYGPDYTITIGPTLIRDTNKTSYLEECISKINDNLVKYVAQSETGKPSTKKMKTDLAVNKKKTLMESNKIENRNKTVNQEKVSTSEQQNSYGNNTKVFDVYEFIE